MFCREIRAVYVCLYVFFDELGYWVVSILFLNLDWKIFNIGLIEVVTLLS